MDNLERITIDEAVCNSKPVIRGFRITVKTVLEYLAAGENIENILVAYPFLEEDDINMHMSMDSSLSRMIPTFIIVASSTNSRQK